MANYAWNRTGTVDCGLSIMENEKVLELPAAAEPRTETDRLFSN